MKHLLRWCVVAGLAPLLKQAPAWMTRTIAAAAGLAQYALYAGARRAIRRGLGSDLGLSQLRLERAVLGSFYHHLLNDLELEKYPSMDREFVERHVSLTGAGWEHLRSGQRQGLLLVTFHFGPNQLIIPVLPALGIRFTQIAVPPSYWDRLAGGGRMLAAVNRRRTANLEAADISFVYASEGGRSLRRVVEAVKRGEVLCVAGDGGLGRRREFPFLRGRIPVALGAFHLAARYGLAVVPVFAVRGTERTVIEMQAPLPVRDSNVEAVIQRCVSGLAEHVRRRPEQYGWLYHVRAVGG